MARSPRQANDLPVRQAPDAMLADMDLEQHYRANLLKELSQSYLRDRDRASEAVLVDGTLYYWWWKFIQAHYQHPSTNRDAQTDADVAAIQDKFGEPNLDFRDWWTQTGRDLFQEQGDLPLIKVVEMDRDVGPDEFPRSITLKIPLTISRDGIVHQLDKILAVCHPGPRLKRHNTSTARLTINPKPRYRIDKLPDQLKIWAKIQSEPQWLSRPDEEWWQIARFMGTSKFEKKKLEYDEYEHLTGDIKRELGRTARRSYDQADRNMSKAVRGVFPFE